MSYSRPKRPPKDNNHDDVVWVLKHLLGGYHRTSFTNEKGQDIKGAHIAHYRGLRVAAYDTANMGNDMLDWLIWVSWVPIAIEIKAPREVKDASRQKLTDEEYYKNQLQIGERVFFRTFPGLSAICADTESIFDLIRQLAEFVFFLESLFPEISNDISGKDYINLFFPRVEEEAQWQI